MTIEYSYGLFMRYFMKYLGGIFSAVFAFLFLFMAALTLGSNLLKEMPIKFGLFIFMCAFMVWFLAWGSYYCFKYSDLFTKKLMFKDHLVSIIEGNNFSDSFSNIPISKVIYRAPLFVFEIYFNNSYRNSIIVMNNGSQSESEEFLKLKELLKTHHNFSTKWW